MVVELQIESQGIGAFSAYLDARLQRMPVTLEDGAAKGAAVAQRALKQYPSHPSPRPQWQNGFKSDRQRRYFFWALANGVISVPYRRTHRQRKGWQLRSFGGGPVARVAVYNNVPSVKWTQDERTQSRYHSKSGWTTVQQVQRRLTAEIGNAAATVIANEFG